MVADTPDVEQVIRGEGGLLEGARPGSVVVDMSTISPAATRIMARCLASKGVEMLDAPVSGGDIGAVKGTLSIMVGGKPEVFARVKPLLQCMGTTIVHIGESGAGQVAKACNQIMTAINRVGVSEALVFARRNGVDPARVREALMGGLAGSKILELHGQRMLDGDYKPGFKVRLQHKDIRIAIETAHALGLTLPATALVGQYLNALMGRGEGELDAAAIGTVVERMNAR
jgi:2-hydroxy-3-oxopropionate reductase